MHIPRSVGAFSRVPRVSSFRNRFEFLIAKAVQTALSVFPRLTVQIAGKFLGQAFYWADGRHRRMAENNLRQAGLGLNETMVREVARASFRHFGAMFLSSVQLASMDEEEIRSWTIIEGLEHFDAAKAEGRGFIQLTGHYGDWEFLALAQSLEGRRLAVIGRELDNPLLDAWVHGFRERFGNRVIPKAGGARGAIKAIKQADGVGYLLDQDALGMGVFVPFLGRWASTFSSAGAIAVRFDLPILPVFSWPEPDGRLRIKFEPAFHAPQTGDEAHDVWFATWLMVARIEAQIRKEPRLWFWMHNRFKTQPNQPGSPALPPNAWLEGAGLSSNMDP